MNDGTHVKIDTYLETWIRKKEISWTKGNIMKETDKANQLDKMTEVSII